MTMTADPIIDNWYKDLESNQIFEVISYDIKYETVELQYADGDISDIDRDSWNSSSFEPIEPPGDWSAPYGSIEMDDLGYTDNDIHAPSINDIELDQLVSNF